VERVRSGFHRGSTRRILQYSNKFKRRGLRNRLFLYSHQRIALGQVILLDKCERPKLGNKAGADIRRHKYNLRGRRLEQYIEQCVPHRQAERQQFRDVCRSPGRNQRLRPNLRQLVAGHYSLGKHREFARDQHRVAATMGFVLHELVSNSDIILCGTYPIPPLSTGNTGPDIILQNAIIRTNAMMFADQGWSVAYFDGSTPFIDTNNAIARGYCPLNDVHYSPAGYAAYGYFLWSWMDLAGARTYGNNYVGTFTGDGSGLTGLNPANLSAGTAAINISGNAATATNAIHATTADTATTAGMSIPMPAYNPAQRTTNYFRLSVVLLRLR